MIFVGIDPGKTGHVALIDENGRYLDDFAMPLLGDELDASELAAILKDATAVAIEQVGAMPGNGGVSMFNFGRIFGEALAMVKVSGVPMVRPRPQAWQKDAFRGRPKGNPKETSRMVAAERWPGLRDRFKLKKSCGLADALHLADYARRDCLAVQSSA